MVMRKFEYFVSRLCGADQCLRNPDDDTETYVRQPWQEPGEGDIVQKWIAAPKVSFDELGRYGWELVTIHTRTDGWTGAYFKREMTEDATL